MARYARSEAQEWAWEHLRGQWSTLMTPFTPDDRVDEEALRSNVRQVRALGVRGAGCSWGMGEFWSLTHDERVRIYDIVAGEAGGQWLVAAHVSHTSAREMLSLADHAESAGVDLLIVTPPAIACKTEAQVVEYVRLLADHTNLAIMFYNTPQFGLVMSPQGLGQLCRIPNVVGVKEASFNRELSIEAHLQIGRDAVISTPDEWIFWKGEELGFRQQVMFANTSDWRFDTPEANHYVQFVERATRGDLDTRFYDTHLREIKGVSDKWWGYTMKKFGGVLPVSLCKYWGELMGLSHGHVRPPLADLSPEEQEQIRQEVAALRPLASGAGEQRGVAPDQAEALRSRVYVTTPAGGGNGTAGGGNGAAARGNGAAHGPSSAARPGWLPQPVAGSGMMLMVSVQNMEEALEAERGGADVVDVKNLQEAMVGSGHPLLVKQVRERIPAEKHVSVTLGVVPNQPGTVAMAAHAAARLDATSVKIGFVKTDYETAVETLREARRALEGSETKLIGSLFADNHLYDGLDPSLTVQLAQDGQCDGFLIDTLTKDGRNLFDFIPEQRLREIVLQGKELGMSTALSGHLRLEDLDELARVNPDIVGVRGAVCASGDRNRTVAWESVAHFREELGRRKSGEVDPRRSAPSQAPKSGGSGGWVVVDGRGKSCAGVLAALTQQMESDSRSFVEAILADALNIYDVVVWAEQHGHSLLTQRAEQDGTLRVLIKP